MSRYTNDDVGDLIAVFRQNSIAALDVSEIWAKALKDSPLSSQLGQVKKQMEDFFSTASRNLWEGKQRQEAMEDFRSRLRKVVRKGNDVRGTYYKSKTA